jgi:hypothetical protein
MFLQMLVTTYNITQHHNLQDHSPHCHDSENLKLNSPGTLNAFQLIGLKVAGCMNLIKQNIKVLKSHIFTIS